MIIYDDYKYLYKNNIANILNSIFQYNQVILSINETIIRCNKHLEHYRTGFSKVENQKLQIFSNAIYKSLNEKISSLENATKGLQDSSEGLTKSK